MNAEPLNLENLARSVVGIPPAPASCVTLEGEAQRLRDHVATLRANALRGALNDMLAGWRFIRAMHGDLAGVGWDRAQRAAESALGLPIGGIPTFATIGPEEMVANLRHMQAAITVPKNIENLTLTLRGRRDDDEPYGVTGYVSGSYELLIGYGATPQAALNAFAAKIPKQATPAELRDKAAKLLAEAEKLEAHPPC